MKDFTLAVSDSDQFVPLVKAYLGLTAIEMRRADAFIKKHNDKRFGPVLTVNPEINFELNYEGGKVLKRRKSGIPLNSLRIKRWSSDKKVTEANTSQDFHQMLAQYG